MKYVPPSIRETAFNCAYCGAFANQRWSTLYTNLNTEDEPLPFIVSREQYEEIDLNVVEVNVARNKLPQWADKMVSGRPFLERERSINHLRLKLFNTFISECFNCKYISVWIYDKLVYPQRGEAPPANPDLPDDIRQDYDKASSILDLSPRGAAALIRLAIQKLCKELGQPGKKLNADIGKLVENGLDIRIQQALDAVRVIGNNAVHPGQIDLRDDRVVAESLFRLLNLIAEKMISEPKHVEEVYATLPEDALEAIERRDAK